MREALRAAHLIVASYQQKAQDPETYLKQVASMLTGVHAETLMRIANPNRGGIVAECRFLPSLAEIRDWLDKAEAPYFAEIQRAKNEIETLTYQPEPEVSAEERHRRLETSAQVSGAMRPQQPATREIEWLKPESEQSPAHRAESARARRCQAPDTPEQRAKLMDSTLMKSSKSVAA